MMQDQEINVKNVSVRSAGSLLLFCVLLLATPALTIGADNLTGAVPPPQITSTSHPDQNAWYRAKIGQLSWNLPAGTTAISYSLDQDPTAVLTGAYPVASSFETPPLPEGVSYFHLRLRGPSGWSETANYALHVDTVTPMPFSIQFPDGTSTRNFSPRISFGTRDSGSGILRYDVYLDGKLFRSVTSGESQTLAVNLPRAGTYRIEVQAFDAAGNASVADGSVTLIGLPDMFVSRVLILAGILLLIVMAFLILPAKGREKSFAGESKKDPAEILGNEFRILQSDFDKIKKDLLGLAKFRSSQKIFAFMEASYQKGLSDAAIRKKLEKTGWLEEDIDSVFEEYARLEKMSAAIRKNLKDLYLES